MRYLHEIGHYVGLRHPENPWSWRTWGTVMHPWGLLRGWRELHEIADRLDEYEIGYFEAMVGDLLFIDA